MENDVSTPMTMEHMQEQSDDLMVVIAELAALNSGEPTRSRELSLAITNLEQGWMWLQRALGKVYA